MKLNRSSYLVCFFFFLIFSSCMPTVSELWVNEDESGKMEMTYDLGEMAGMAQGFMSELEPDKEQKDMWAKKEKIDSTMNFYDIMPDSVKREVSNAEFLKNMNLSLSVDSEKEQAEMKLSVKYKDDNEMLEIMKVLKESRKDNSNPMMAMQGEDELDQMMIQYKADYKNGIIRLPAMDISEFFEDPELKGMMDALAGKEGSDPEELEFLRMMLGDKTKVVVHAPGKILFTDDPNAIVEGNKATFEDDILEYLKAGKARARLIKFKN